MGKGAIIEFRNCTKRFGTKTVLDNISFSIEKSKCFISVIGPSGCGKTTLLRMIAGLDLLDEGEILLDGQKAGIKQRNIIAPHKRSIGFVFQDLALFPHLTVYENIAYGLKVLNVKDLDYKVKESLKEFHIEALSKNYPNQLSGGQQQLVALARTLVLNPKILLMDEPLASLDVKLKNQIRSLVKKISIDMNITILYVTHDHKEALELSDQILLLNEGKIEFFGKTTELLSSSNDFSREFIDLK